MCAPCLGSALLVRWIFVIFKSLGADVTSLIAAVSFLAPDAVTRIYMFCRSRHT
jgi:hypothetical protein